LKGEESIPKKVQVKNNKVVGYSDETVSVADISSIGAYWLKIKDYQQAERLF
jgi:hypothetical protein